MNYDYQNQNNNGFDYNNQGYNEPPYGGPYGQPPQSNFNGYNNNGRKMKYPKFIPVSDWMTERRRIVHLSAATAFCIIGFILLSNILGTVVYALQTVLRFDLSAGSNALYVYELISTVFCVGLPFLIMYNTMNNKGYYFAPMPLDKPKNRNFIPIYIVIGLAGCFIGDVLSSLLASISSVMSKATETMSSELAGVSDNTTGIILMTISTAIMPAFIEEFAVRGVIMQPLRRYGDDFAIVVSSIIFGLLHCNYAQIPFAFIAGIILGYVAIITDSLWCSVIIHFLNNLYSVIASVLADKYGTYSPSSIIFSGVLFYLVIIIGAFLAWQYFKKQTRPHIRMSPIVNHGKNYYNINNPYSAKVSYKSLGRAYFLNVPMIIAIIAVVITATISLAQT